MKTEPTSAFDLILSYISPSYCHFNQLTGNQVSSLDKVIGVLSKVVKKYIDKFGKIPVLCIDGVDLVAKKNEQLCSTLVALAKLMVNTNRIKSVARGPSCSF